MINSVFILYSFHICGIKCMCSCGTAKPGLFEGFCFFWNAFSCPQYSISLPKIPGWRATQSSPCERFRASCCYILLDWGTQSKGWLTLLRNKSMFPLLYLLCIICDIWIKFHDILTLWSWVNILCCIIHYVWLGHQLCWSISSHRLENVSFSDRNPK